MQVSNYLKLSEVNNLTRSIGNRLSRLGISIDQNNKINFEWENNKNIMEIVKSEDVFNLGADSICLKASIAIAFVESEEINNNFLPDSELKFLNDFFNVDIDRPYLNKIYAKYI